MVVVLLAEKELDVGTEEEVAIDSGCKEEIDVDDDDDVKAFIVLLLFEFAFNCSTDDVTDPLDGSRPPSTDGLL